MMASDTPGEARTREAVAGMLNDVIGRGVHLYLLFSGVPRNYNYEGQFRDAFPDVAWRGRVTVSYCRDVDHTFSRMYMQEKLLSMIRSWAVARFGTESPASSPTHRQETGQRPLAIPADGLR